MYIGTVFILLPYWFTWLNELWNTTCKTSFPKQGGFSWCQPFDVSFSVNYSTEVDVQSPNNKISSLKWCQQTYALCEVIILHKSTYKIQMKKYIPWNGDPFQKYFTMSPFHDHFSLYWLLEILHPKCPNFPCYSSRCICNLNQFWI